MKNVSANYLPNPLRRFVITAIVIHFVSTCLGAVNMLVSLNIAELMMSHLVVFYVRSC